MSSLQDRTRARRASHIFKHGETIAKGRRQRANMRMRVLDPSGRVVDTDVVKLVAGQIFESDLDLGAIAERAELCTQTVSRVLYGDVSEPRMSTIVKLLRVFGYVLVFQKVS